MPWRLGHTASAVRYPGRSEYASVHGDSVANATEATACDSPPQAQPIGRYTIAASQRQMQAGDCHDAEIL